MHISEMQSLSLIKVAAVAAILALGGLGRPTHSLMADYSTAVILAMASASPANSMTMADECLRIALLPR